MIITHGDTPPSQSATGGKARVYELAKEFGVDSKVVLAKLKEMGEFVKSASSTVEYVVVRRLREAFGGRAGRPTPPSATGSRSTLPQAPRVRPAPPPTPAFPPLPPAIKRSNSGRNRLRPLDQVFTDQDEASVARSLGLRGIPTSRGPRVPLTGTAARLRERFWQISDDDTARDVAKQWASAFVDEAEAVAWWDAGLGPFEHAKVRALKDYDIQPAHLYEVVNGQRVGALLRGGATVAYVAGLLRAHGHIS